MAVKLETRSISKSFDGVKIIEDISIHLDEGELVCLLGVSGGGKTTLFNIIAGLSRPDAGQVLIDGADTTGVPGQVSYMLQKDLLLPFKTVLDNICLPLVIRGERKADARRQAEQHLKFFGLEGMGGKYPSQLSGGQRQRAALLRTYLFSGQMLLLDEPFSALDAITKSAIHDWYLDMVRQMEASTLLITHDIELALRGADRIAVFYVGTTVEVAEAADFEKEELLRHPYTKALWRAMPANGFSPIEGSQPYAKDLLEGCVFQERCPWFGEECRKEIPLRQVRGGLVRCVRV